MATDFVDFAVKAVGGDEAAQLRVHELRFGVEDQGHLLKGDAPITG